MTHWTHDCSNCVSLGDFVVNNKLYDLYWCPTGGLGAPTVVARFGNEGWQYQSGIEMAKSGQFPELAEAYRRGVAAGYSMTRTKAEVDESEVKR